MNTFSVFSEATVNSTVERLGWVLLHSLWQFAAIAMLSTLVVRCLRRSSASSRYGFLVFALATCVLCPIATWYMQHVEAVDIASKSSHEPPLERASELSQVPIVDIGEALGIASEPQEPAAAVEHPTIIAEPTVPSPLLIQVRAALRPWLAWIVVTWSLGVMVCAMRPLLSWVAIRKLRREGATPVSRELLDVLCRVSKQIGVTRTVQLLQSTVVQVPVVLGYLRPMILLPVCLLSNLPISQLEAIIAHELAHIRRHDFVVNLLQTIIETLFFYHPAAWWLSHRIRIEREHCCDDLVVQLVGNRVEYGRALVAIEQLRGASGVLALGAADGSMLSRIRRIVAQRENSRVVSQWSPLNVLATILVFVAMTGLLCWRGLAQAASEPLAAANQEQTQAESPLSDDAEFSDELTLRLTREDAHGGKWYFIDLEKGQLKTPPFDVDIDAKRLPYFVNKPEEADLNAWLSREGVDLILRSNVWWPNSQGAIEKNEIQVRSVRTLLQDLPYSLQQNADKSWAWTTIPHDIIRGFARKDDAVHVTGFVPNSFAGDIRPDSPVLRPFRTANNLLGLFMLEQPSVTKDELTLRIVHVQNSNSLLDDLRFGPDDFVSGKIMASSTANETRVAPFSATFPNDIRVEFVGLTAGAGDIKASDRWWKPDGSPLDIAPDYRGASGVDGDEEKNPSVRSVIHVHGIKDEAAVTATAAIQLADSRVDASGGRYVAHHGYSDAPSATRSFEVGVATEPLSLKRWLDRNGNRQGFQAKTRSLERSVGFALVGCMDVDGNSTDDSDKVKELIRMATGHVDAVLDENLVAKGSLGSGTAFVVIGSDSTNNDKEHLEKYAAFIKEAKNFGATQMSLSELMGYVRDGKLQWPLDPIKEDITIEKVGPETWGQHVAGYGPIIDPVGPGDEQGGRKTVTTQVTLRVPLKWRQVDLRLFAVDKAGKSHPVDLTVRLEPNEENADYTRLAKILPISFDLVDHFEYQFRLYRHWVTFENISLRKGEITKVNINPETISSVEAVKQSPSDDAVIALGNRLITPTIQLPDFVNVMAVRFSADDRTLTSVATQGDVSIRTWDIAARKLVREIKLDTKVGANEDPIYEIQFLNGGLGLSQDSKRLVACTNGKVRIWNTDDGKLIQTLPNPIRDGRGINPRGLTSTPNFNIIAAAIGGDGFRSNDAACEIAIWQGEGYGRIKRLSHAAAVQITSLALSVDGSRLASGSQTASTCVFDLADGRLLYTLPNSNGDRKHPDPKVTEAGANQVVCLAFSPDGKKLAIGDLMGVKLVNATSGELIHAMESPFRFGRSGLMFSSDGKLLARTATDTTVPIWSTETGKLMADLPTEAHDAAFSSNGKWFATGFTDDKQALSVWKFDNGAQGTLRHPEK